MQIIYNRNGLPLRICCLCTKLSCIGLMSLVVLACFAHGCGAAPGSTLGSGLVDSDGDGFSDDVEINGVPGTDPFDATDNPNNVRDTDGDGCSDYDELNFTGFCDNDPNSPVSPLNAGTYNGTIECLRTFTDGSTEVSTQEWIVVIGDSGIPTSGDGDIVPGMVLTPPPNSTLPSETVLYVTVSANAVVIFTEFENQVTLCANTCQFSFDGVCDDGFTGATTSLCQAGSDCFDCGDIVFQTTGTKRSTYKVLTSTSIEYIRSEIATISGSQDSETRECSGILVR